MQSYDKALKNIDKYIWALSHRFAKGLHGCDPADLHQEGLIKFYEVYTSASYSSLTEDELNQVFKTSLVHRFIDIKREQTLQDKMLVTVDLDDVSYMFGEDAFGELNLQYCQEYLAHFVSNDAALLLELLLEPSAELVWEFQKQTMRREHLRRQGIPTVITHKIPYHMAGQILGFGKSKTKNLLRELRQAFLEHMCSARNYKLNVAMC